jgi:hypothetical protein
MGLDTMMRSLRIFVHGIRRSAYCENGQSAGQDGESFQHLRNFHVFKYYPKTLVDNSLLLLDITIADSCDLLILYLRPVHPLWECAHCGKISTEFEEDSKFLMRKTASAQ